MQTRLLHFGPGAVAPAGHSLQVHSAARWGREDIGFDREDWQEADACSLNNHAPRRFQEELKCAADPDDATK